MELSHKKIMQNLMYYTLIAITIALSVLYMIALSPNDVMTYAKVVYYIWTVAVVILLILDIVFTIMGSGKFFTGIALYILTLACIVMGIIVYLDLMVGGVLPETSMYMFTRLVIFSGVIDVLFVVTYITGEFISSTNSSGKK